MATNHTENYGLNLWEPEDAFLRAEFNENSEKLDAAIVAAVRKAETELAAVEAAQLRWQTFTYNGSGEKTLTLTFVFPPKLVFIVPLNTETFGAGILFRGQTSGMPVRSPDLNQCFSVKWGEKTLTLATSTSYAGAPAVFQAQAWTYGVLALG